MLLAAILHIIGNSNLTNTGYFKITIPHSLLDGKYTVFVDGKVANFTEEQFFTKSNTDTGSESATQDDFTPIVASHITIAYPKDAKSIDIVGTTAAPEFGLASLGILVTSAIAVIVLGRHHRGS
jgi:hypothetical protein